MSVILLSESQMCGICEQFICPEERNPEIIWSTPYSRFAHVRCAEVVRPTYRETLETIRRLFPRIDPCDPDQNNAFARATGAVRKACGMETILSYCQTHGEERLKNLFQTVGLDAANSEAPQHRYVDCPFRH
jgi:hypothetical protein